MKRQKIMNNKGFSLVELIIVIAIMAILVGAISPQLIRFLDRANVSADTQLADTVKSAVTYAVMDPVVVEAANNGIPADDTATQLSALSDRPFGQEVAATLGTTVADLDDIEAKLKSDEAKEIWITITEAGTVKVEITKDNPAIEGNVLITVE